MKRLIERIVREYLLEERKFPKQKGSEVYDKMLYNIISTHHQWFDRHGDNSYKENIDLFYEKNNSDNDYRIVVARVKKNVTNVKVMGITIVVTVTVRVV